ncbi:hypothetical protein NQZ68_041849 [Dissostichus eleginoides]|nr:hypothetical protein NQZ68_041849 [Dissostichus eleginoides]
MAAGWSLLHRTDTGNFHLPQSCEGSYSVCGDVEGPLKLRHVSPPEQEAVLRSAQALSGDCERQILPQRDVEHTPGEDQGGWQPRSPDPPQHTQASGEAQLQ